MTPAEEYQHNLNRAAFAAWISGEDPGREDPREIPGKYPCVPDGSSDHQIPGPSMYESGLEALGIHRESWQTRRSRLI